MNELTDKDLRNLYLVVNEKFWKEKAKQRYGTIPRKWHDLSNKLGDEMTRRGIDISK